MPARLTSKLLQILHLDWPSNLIVNLQILHSDWPTSLVDYYKGAEFNPGKKRRKRFGILRIVHQGYEKVMRFSMDFFENKINQCQILGTYI